MLKTMEYSSLDNQTQLYQAMKSEDSIQLTALIIKMKLMMDSGQINRSELISDIDAIRMRFRSEGDLQNSAELSEFIEELLADQE